MNWKKITFIFIVFLTFLGSGKLLSNVQSREADQLLEAHGLTINTRYFYPQKKTTVSEFIQYLQKHYAKKKMQVHLANRQDSNQTLIWANHEITALPTESGRYFTQDDFNGRVSFAVLSPDSEKDILDVQNNKYVIYHKRYYSVIGTFKNHQNNQKNSYYLTTGSQQPTGKFPLTNYRIMIDCNSRNNLKKIAKHFGGTIKAPTFVQRHQIYRFSVIREIILILLLWIIAMIANALIAMMQWRQLKLSHLKGKLLRNWVTNRGLRLILIDVLLEVIAYGLLRWLTFYTKSNHLILLLLLNLLAAVAAYLFVWIILYWRERKNA